MKVKVNVTIEGLKVVIPTNADVNLNKFNFNIDEEMTDTEFVNTIKGVKDMVDSFLKAEQENHETPVTNITTKTISNPIKPQRVVEEHRRPVEISDDLWSKIDKTITEWRSELKNSEHYLYEGSYPMISVSTTDTNTNREVIKITREDKDPVTGIQNCVTACKYEHRKLSDSGLLNYFSYYLTIYNDDDIRRHKSDNSCHYGDRIHDDSLRELMRRLVKIMDEVK